MFRFLCDEMLGRLARYLRAAGYDTLAAQAGESDAELLRQARRQDRYFLTRDRRVLEHKAASGVALLLPEGGLDDFAAGLSGYLHLDWLAHAFTRCLVDNTPLEIARPDHGDALPPNVSLGEARHCPTCGRLYWAGSHHRRMRARLQCWQERAASQFGMQRDE